MTPEQREFEERMFAALASGSRLRILEFLAQGPAAVKSIAAATGLKQSITSQHLGALLSAGVVVVTRIGNQRIYALRGPRVAGILGLVDEFYRAHLGALRGVAERHSEAESASADKHRPPAAPGSEGTTGTGDSSQPRSLPSA
jgi:DNA-binding transcriptional ArsR family regulator